MRKTKKPAIASEWRENKKAQERADQMAAKEQARAARSEALSRISAAAGYLMTAGGWVVCLTLAVLFAISLATYAPADPGFSETGTQKAANLCGIFGAWAADFSYWLLGRSAWWAPVVLAFAGVQMVRALWARANTMPFSLRLWSMGLGFVVLMSASVGLETLQFGYLGLKLPLGGGGLYGQFVASQVTPFLGIWGSTILFGLLLAAGMSFVFGFSWFDVAERIGRIFERIVKFFTFSRPKAKEEAKSEVTADEAEPQAAQREAAADDVPWAQDSLPAAVAAAKKKRAAKPKAKPAAAAPDPDAPVTPHAPDLDILESPPAERQGISSETVEKISRLIETKLKTYRIDAQVVGAQAGPVITQYWLELAPGVKGSRVDDIRRDLTRSLSVDSVRVVSVIPGKPYMGLEIPNGSKQRLAVYLKEIIGSPDFTESRSSLSLALGKDIAGNAVCADLTKMPHLLIAGTTGSGKSVCLNTMIASILYNATPDEVKLLMIDPKQVEFTVYNGIAHLAVPVVSDPRKASGALTWAVNEMENRYKILSEKNVRDIKGYNKLAERDKSLRPMHQIVIFIDELADLMMVAPNEVEDAICRLAQKARAAGMHLVIATQRPSVDVITGIIKANIPSRLALSVSSSVDSRTILDMSGAEKLIGNGDMLFNPIGANKPTRIQGCFISDEEVENVADFIKHNAEAEYDEGIMDEINRQAAIAGSSKKSSAASSEDGEEPGDEMFPNAVEVVLDAKMASTTLLQRKLKLGYARAARLMDELESKGIIGPFEGSKPRQVLITKQQWMEKCALSDAPGDDEI